METRVVYHVSHRVATTNPQLFLHFPKDSTGEETARWLLTSTEEKGTMSLYGQTGETTEEALAAPAS